jgi:hypothetical protein
MPESKETWQEIEAQLLRINQSLQAMQSETQADARGNGRLRQQVTLPAGLVGQLNDKLDAEIERRRAKTALGRPF